MNSPGQNTGVGSLSLLQGIFPTQGSNPDLPHCRRILYQLSYLGSPKSWSFVNSVTTRLPELLHFRESKSPSSCTSEAAIKPNHLGLIPELGRSPGEAKGCPLQYSGLGNSMDYIVHGVAESRTRLSDFHFPFPFPFQITNPHSTHFGFSNPECTNGL